MKTFLRLRNWYTQWQIKNNTTHKAVYFSLSLLVIAIPVVSTYMLIHTLLGQQLTNFVPQWSDEIFYCAWGRDIQGSEFQRRILYVEWAARCDFFYSLLCMGTALSDFIWQLGKIDRVEIIFRPADQYHFIYIGHCLVYYQCETQPPTTPTARDGSIDLLARSLLYGHEHARGSVLFARYCGFSIFHYNHKWPGQSHTTVPYSVCYDHSIIDFI